MPLQNGVDKNCINRVLLRSAKPALHANVDCTPLVAAIVSRQMNMVKYLLEVIKQLLFLKLEFLTSKSAKFTWISPGGSKN